MPIRRILFATDFSEPSAHALAYAVEFARRLGSKIRVVHVLALHEADVATAEEQMPLTVPDGLDDVVDARDIVRAPTAELGIIREARHSQTDLIVLGTHGRTGLKHVFLGSVAERVVQLASGPVLTVRTPEHVLQDPEGGDS
jgi:nucleotide-binding universal stress UspA family protein